MLLLSRSKQEPGKWQQYKTDHSSHLQKKWKSQMVQLSLPAQPYVTFFCQKNSDTPSCYQSQHSTIISLLARLSGPDIGMAQQSLKVRSYKPPLPSTLLSFPQNNNYYLCLPEIKMKSLPIVVKRRNHPGSTTHIHQQNEGYR